MIWLWHPQIEISSNHIDFVVLMVELVRGILRARRQKQWVQGQKLEIIWKPFLNYFDSELRIQAQSDWI